MENKSFQRAQTITFSVLAILLVVFLMMLGIRENTTVRKERANDSYSVVRDVTRREIDDPVSPAGKVVELTFPLDAELAYDTELIFYVSHQWLDVYVGEEAVYSLRPSGALSFIKTSGGKWVIVPIYRSDAGATVRVIMTPAYENHLVGNTVFFVGSSLTVYREQFQLALPAIALSLVNILIGILLLMVAVYCKLTGKDSSEVLPLSALGISMGLWQLTHNDFSPFILEGKEIFLYYISVTMMLICMIPLVCSTGVRFGQGRSRVLHWYLLAVAVMASVQIVLQMLGVIDLREMFPLTHGSIILGALLLIVSSIYGKVKGRSEPGNSRHSWILAVGAIGDLLLYYIRGTSSGLIMILTAVLCFMLLEGASFLSQHVKQSRMLAEKETQLENSRVMITMSQIRSHFVFNILNAISGMCKYDPEKADETVVRFARYLRNNIDIMEDDKMLPFTVELQRLEDYVILEQVRFGDRIEFLTDLEVTDFMLPPLILQPIVENAIKHGISKKPDGGTILLSTREESDRIVIEVDDDGIGFDTQTMENGTSIGLKNIRFRLRSLTGGTLTIRSTPGKGTKAIISIPRKEA